MQRTPRSPIEAAGTVAARERQAREPRGSARPPGTRGRAPPSPALRRGRGSGVALPWGSGMRATRSCPRGPESSRRQPTCSAEGTLPSIAATADARRSSSRQSRAIAGRRPPGRARAETAARGGRRVPGRRCAPRGGLLRILSRSRWDRTARSTAWAWAGVCARGAVRARVGVGVHVCVCVYGRGGCVRACVEERGRGSASWGERESAYASRCHIASCGGAYVRPEPARLTGEGAGSPTISSLPTPNTSCPIKESNLQKSLVQSGASTSLPRHC